MTLLLTDVLTCDRYTFMTQFLFLISETSQPLSLPTINTCGYYMFVLTLSVAMVEFEPYRYSV